MKRLHILNTMTLIVLTSLLTGCNDENMTNHATYDIVTNGIPKFIAYHFTELDKIESISRFRSGYGHDYSDTTESCRSMKHYYAPYTQYLQNNTVKIYAPINGSIISIEDEGHGNSDGLHNKQIHIRSNTYPAFTFVLFHCDLLDNGIQIGTHISAGELIAYARLKYPDLNETAHDFDIAIWVDTPDGVRYLSYFDLMTDTLFSTYQIRGIDSRAKLIISVDQRDSNPLTCNGKTFTNISTLTNWVTF